MIYPTLHLYNKFFLTVYPIIYCCRPDTRDNIHIQLLILTAQISADNIIEYVERKWDFMKPYVQYIKPVITVSTMTCISHQMSLINNNESSMLSRLSMTLCNWIQNVTLNTISWSIYTPIIAGVLYLSVKPIMNSYYNRAQESVRGMMTLENINRLINTLNNTVTQIPNTRTTLTETELLFITPPKFKGNDSTVLEDVTCAVCLEKVTENNIYRQLPCKHHFHPSCIDKWLLECSDKCPCCNTKVTTVIDNMIN